MPSRVRLALTTTNRSSAIRRSANPSGGQNARAFRQPPQPSGGRSAAGPAVSPESESFPGPGLAVIMMAILVHAGIAFVPRGSIVAFAYAGATLVVAVGIVLWRPQPEWALYSAAYVVGAEVFWRMSQAGVLHEYGKYSVCVILLVGLARQGRLRIPFAPAVYLCLLVPAVVVTFLEFEWYTSRRLISQNFSGPLTLVVCAIYCHGILIRRAQVISMMLALVLPLISVAAYAARGIAMTSIDWGGESNFGASGGFGPNQVSAMMGLGAYAALLVIVLGRSLWLRVLSGGILLWFLSQAALTFSRTGVYLFGLAAGATAIFLLRDPKARLRFLLGAAAAGLLGTFVIYPALDQLTGGAMGRRFAETTLSNRSEIAAADVQVWKRNWLFGAGIGQAKFERTNFGFEESAAHTEYTRLLAEHGALGLFALLLLFGSAAKNFFSQRGTGRSFVAGALAWALAFMFASATRLAAPSLLIGLSFAALRLTPAQKRLLRPS